MEKKWYVKIDGEQVGPFIIEDLSRLKRQGKFDQNTPVWVKIGNKFDWVKASEITPLQDLFHSIQDEEELDGIFEDAPDSIGQLLDKREDKVWSFASGKGGVGKTLLASACAIVLAKLGKRVVIVDLDLGGSNMHTIFGLPQPTSTLDDFISKKTRNINDVCIKTPVENLFLISGIGGCLGYANPKHVQKIKIISKLREIKADYVLLDIGAGSSYNELDFFLAADRQIIVTCPEPSSIQDGYNFAKTALYRKLRYFFKRHPDIVDFLDQLRQEGYVSDMNALLSKIFTLGPDYIENFGKILKNYSPQLIVNMVMEKEEAKEGFAAVIAAKKLLNIDLHYLGFIYFDLEVRKSTKELIPFILKNPQSRASVCTFSILCDRILKMTPSESSQQKKVLSEQIQKTLYRTAAQKGHYNELSLYPPTKPAQPTL
ncbi:MAG: AAA family ATPase [Deltaproteobacteria bacterium]|nr:AAA family ATPase [Deltaproteobacteria bacterium]